MSSAKSLFIITLGIIASTAACEMFEKSDYSNCVVAENESSFIGEWLKNDDKNVEAERILTTECVAKDQNIDGGNGEKKGKVRWVVCLKGPDCDEAGMF